MDQPLPLTQDLVLSGGGHTHALVLRKWGMAPLPGARLTLINPGPTAPYTGMLPGHVAGHYSREALDIDLIRLARFAGARLILGAVKQIDRAAQRILVDGRPPISYDVASINVGITSDLPELPGFSDFAIPAKPLDRFADAWRLFVDHSSTVAQPPNIAVIGGGVGGVELSLAMAHAMRGVKPKITVIEQSDALPGLAQSAKAALLRQLERYGIELRQGVAAQAITQTGVQLADGTFVPSDFTVGAAGATPHPWLANSDLADDKGFVPVNRHLQTTDPRIFAAGDCAALPDPRPKAGVFAVREAPVLFDNLQKALQGRSDLKRYAPQRDYLKLISLGAKSAVADKWGGRAQGAWVWRWKDWIDQRFMAQFRDFPGMAQTALPAISAMGLKEAMGPKPLCGGCGAKVGATTLAEALQDWQSTDRADVSFVPGDDAAMLTLGGQRQVVTTDHLRAVTQDPYVMARIAAIHALGDIWAMGAAPQAALATIILPRLSGALQSRWLDEILSGAGEVLRSAGAALVGGHTSIGSELTIGFTVTGLLDQQPITLQGAQSGDHLILTKPVGSGTLLAAEMQMQAKGAWITQVFEQMSISQAQAAHRLAHATAMTDVTGFGLAGHLMNICRSSGVGAKLDLAAVPLFDGAAELAAVGIRSTLFEENRRTVGALTAPDTPVSDLLFDPQTAGGLLAAIAPETSAATIAALKSDGYPAAVIGHITDGPPLLTVT